MRRCGQGGFGVVEWILVVVLFLVAVAVIVPYTISEKEDESVLLCVKNLHQLDKAMRLWQLDNAKSMTSPVTMAEILPYLADDAKTNCPSGGHYIVTGLTNPPACTIPGHALANE